MPLLLCLKKSVDVGSEHGYDLLNETKHRKEFEMLPKKTTHCPKDGSKLWFKNLAGLMVIENGSLKAICPACNTKYDVTPRTKP